MIAVGKVDGHEEEEKIEGAKKITELEDRLGQK
jgi:hypothetical protein